MGWSRIYPTDMSLGDLLLVKCSETLSAQRPPGSFCRWGLKNFQCWQKGGTLYFLSFSGVLLIE